MRKIVEDTEDGLESYLGQRITLFCMNYIYTGKLSGVNATCVKLDEPKIVYETGPFEDKHWKDAQALPSAIYVQLSAVEAWGVVK